MEFILDNYIWFSVAAGVIIMTIIGYLAEKTDFGKKKFEDMAAKKEKEELARQAELQIQKEAESVSENIAVIAEPKVDTVPVVPKKMTRLEKLREKKRAAKEAEEAKKMAKQAALVAATVVVADNVINQETPEIMSEVTEEVSIIEPIKSKETFSGIKFDENGTVVEDGISSVEEAQPSKKEKFSGIKFDETGTVIEDGITMIEKSKELTEVTPVEITEEEATPSYEVPEINVDEIEDVKEVTEEAPVEITEEVATPSYEVPEINIDEIEEVKEVTEEAPVEITEEVATPSYEIPEITFGEEDGNLDGMSMPDLEAIVGDDVIIETDESSKPTLESPVKEIELDLPNIEDLTKNESAVDDQKVVEDDDIWKF